MNRSLRRITCLALGLAVLALAGPAMRASAQPLQLPGAQPFNPAGAQQSAPPGAAAGPATPRPPSMPAIRVAGEEAILGRTLRRNGGLGEATFEKTATGHGLKLNVQGFQSENLTEPCAVSFGETPVPVTAMGRPAGVPRYKLEAAACPIVFDVLPLGALSARLTCPATGMRHPQWPVIFAGEALGGSVAFIALALALLTLALVLQTLLAVLAQLPTLPCGEGGYVLVENV